MANGGSVEKSAGSSTKNNKKRFSDFDPNGKSGRRAFFDRIRIITQSRKR